VQPYGSEVEELELDEDPDGDFVLVDDVELLGDRAASERETQEDWSIRKGRWMSSKLMMTTRWKRKVWRWRWRLRLLNARLKT